MNTPICDSSLRQSILNGRIHEIVNAARLRHQFYGDEALQEICSEAALIMLEQGVPFQTAWLRAKASFIGHAQTLQAHFTSLPDQETELPRALTAHDHYFADFADESDTPPISAWFELLEKRIQRALERAHNGTERGNATRALKILKILRERINAEDADGELPSLVIQPRGELYRYILVKLAADHDPISLDYLKHNFIWIREHLTAIAKMRCDIQLRDTRQNVTKTVLARKRTP